MILSDSSLLKLLPKLVKDPDPSLVNPASVDIRIGREALIESRHGWTKVRLDTSVDSCETCPEKPCPLCAPAVLEPGAFALVPTLEYVTVPNGLAVELKLKSTTARKGYNHSLAFWVDPGWQGVLTMEVQNITRFQVLPLICGMRFAQMIVHQLDYEARNPYVGRYQCAEEVEAAKEVGA